MRALVALVVLCVATPARADDREEARKEFAAGQASDKAKDWQGALEHYLRANELVPHPFAMFNIANDYERLIKFREAATWYQRYLDAAQDSADRDKVTKQIAELKNRAAPITVRSIPDGAKVAIDGAPAGATPLSTTIRGGAHKITVDKDGQTDARDVTVEFGEPVDVVFTMRGSSGVLDIHGQPYGALVTVDNMPAGTMPIKLTVAPGQHMVRVTQYGYVQFQAWANVASNATTPVDVNLAKGGMGAFPVPPEQNKIDVGYLLGVNAGADVSGNGSIVLGELGVRINQFDGVVRIGQVGTPNGNTTGVDFLLRWAFTRSSFAPFIGGGYSYINSSAGYEGVFGFKLDLGKGSKLGFSLLADIGARYVSGTFDGTTLMDTSFTDYPLTVSLEAIYR